MEKLYTVTQVAEILTIHKRTIQRWIKERKLKASFVGNKYLVKESDLKAFVDDAQME